MGEADAVYAVSRFELTCSHQRRLIVARNDFVVDCTFNLVALHGNRNLLGYGFALAGRLVHRRIRSATWSIQLKRGWSKTANHAVAVTISRTIQVALVVRSQI